MEIDGQHEGHRDRKGHNRIHQVADTGAEQAAYGGQVVGGARHQVADLIVLEIVQFKLLEVLKQVAAQFVLDAPRNVSLNIASEERKHSLNQP